MPEAGGEVCAEDGSWLGAARVLPRALTEHFKEEVMKLEASTMWIKAVESGEEIVSYVTWRSLRCVR